MMPELFIDQALRAAVILAAALAATIALRRAAAATRHLVWSLAVAGVLVLPAMHAALPAWEVLPDAERTAQAMRVTDAHVVDVAHPSRMTQTSREGRPSPTALRLSVAQRFGAGLILLWALVAMPLLGRIAYGVHAVRQLARHARAADARWRALLHTLAPDAGIRLLVSRDIAMPMTWGSRRPLLLLPAGAAGWSDDRARVVLLHELAHIRRADWLTHALAGVAAALHWFNPLAWTALRAMIRERERACDDYVLARGARASDYAQHLLDIARAEPSGAVLAIAPAMARPSELEGRLLSILTPRRRHAGRGIRLALPTAAVAATGIIAAAAPAAMPDRPAPEPVQEPAAAPRPAPARTNALLGHTLKGDDDEDAAGADVKALTRALEDSSPSVRESAALGLAFRSSDAVVDPLLRALKDPWSQVREKAAIGLAMRQQPRVVDALLEAANDPDSQVREKVVIALGLSGEARVQQTLIAALDDPDDQVREKATQALAALPLADAIRDGIAGALKSFGTNAR